MSDRKAVIKNADMSEEMQQDAVDCATQALEKYNIEKVCSYYKMLMRPSLFGYIIILFDVLWHGKKRNEEEKTVYF